MTEVLGATVLISQVGYMTERMHVRSLAKAEHSGLDDRNP